MPITRKQRRVESIALKNAVRRENVNHVGYLVTMGFIAGLGGYALGTFMLMVIG